MPWAILWRSENELDGEREHLLGTVDHPSRKRLFETREEARAFIRAEYGYIRTRPGLQAEPHGWRMPIAVHVDVHVVRKGSAGNGDWADADARIASIYQAVGVLLDRLGIWEEHPEAKALLDMTAYPGSPIWDKPWTFQMATLAPQPKPVEAADGYPVPFAP